MFTPEKHNKQQNDHEKSTYILLFMEFIGFIVPERNCKSSMHFYLYSGRLTKQCALSSLGEEGTRKFNLKKGVSKKYG